MEVPLQTFVSKVPGQKLKLDHTSLKKIIAASTLTLFRGYAPLSREELIDLCAADPQIDLLHWDFGPVMELEAAEDPKNYLFSRQAVPLHWDGAFYQVPSYLVFNCIQAPPRALGGETFFTDTQAIVKDMKESVEEAEQKELELWSHTSLFYHTEKKAHYGGSFKTRMIEKHPKTGDAILRFAEPVETHLNPVRLSIEGPAARKSEEFIDRVKSKLYSEKYHYVHHWQEGDLLIADNHSLLHGRNPFHEKAPRHIRRVQIL